MPVARQVARSVARQVARSVARPFVQAMNSGCVYSACTGLAYMYMVHFDLLSTKH